MQLLRRVTGLAPAVVACGAAMSGFVAVLGYAMLGFLLLTRYYAPATHHYVRPLNFDYTGYVAVAVAPLSPNLREQVGPPGGGRALPAAAAAAMVPKSRFLPSGTQVAVHVSLDIPWDHSDLFQVTGELLTNATHVAGRSARTHINTPKPYVYRMAKSFILLPLHVMGWSFGDWVRVDLPLFDGYEDREDAPVMAFRARLASRNASRGGLPPPPVHRAELHVRLRLGPLQTLLSWLRPGLAVSVVVLLLGLAASLGGTTAALGLAVLACMVSRWVAESSDGRGSGGKHGGSKAHSHGRALPIAPPSRRKHSYGSGGKPYGGADEAISYSLAHAEFFRSGGAITGVEDGDGWGPTEDDGRLPLVRQGSAASQAPSQAHQHGRDQHEGEQQLGHRSSGVTNGTAASPGWSGSSKDSPGPAAVAAASPGLPASRKTSGAVSVRSEPTAAATTPPRGASPTWLQPSQAEADADEAEVGGDGGPGGKHAHDTSGVDVENYEEASSGSGVAADAEEVGGEVARGDCGKESAAGNRGDLDPQADNEEAAGAVRRRPGFLWHA